MPLPFVSRPLFQTTSDDRFAISRYLSQGVKRRGRGAEGERDEQDIERKRQGRKKRKNEIERGKISRDTENKERQREMKK